MKQVHMATTAIMTGSQFDALPSEEGRPWELVGGELIPAPSPAPQHQAILQRILFPLMVWFNAPPRHGLVFSDVEFAPDADHRVRPDVLVLLGERAASLDMKRVPVSGAPDIAIEVISPSERSFDTQMKRNAYLRFGTQEVWQVYPKTKSIEIHRGETSVTIADGSIETPLLPGFTLETKTLF